MPATATRRIQPLLILNTVTGRILDKGLGRIGSQLPWPLVSNGVRFVSARMVSPLYLQEATKEQNRENQRL